MNNVRFDVPNVPRECNAIHEHEHRCDLVWLCAVRFTWKKSHRMLNVCAIRKLNVQNMSHRLQVEIGFWAWLQVENVFRSQGSENATFTRRCCVETYIFVIQHKWGAINRFNESNYNNNIDAHKQPQFSNNHKWILVDSNRVCNFVDFFFRSFLCIVVAYWGDGMISFNKKSMAYHETADMRSKPKLRTFIYSLAKYCAICCTIFDGFTRDRHTLSGIFKINWKDYVVDLALHHVASHIFREGEMNITWGE